jgi:aryl-alcohol dehydrogenase-like predicted oxidoreductase
VTALTGTKRRTYLDENVAATELELSAEVLAEVSAALPVGAAVGERYDPIKLAAVQE